MEKMESDVEHGATGGAGEGSSGGQGCSGGSSTGGPGAGAGGPGGARKTDDLVDADSLARMLDETAFVKPAELHVPEDIPLVGFAFLSRISSFVVFVLSTLITFRWFHFIRIRLLIDVGMDWPSLRGRNKGDGSLKRRVASL